jgi:hypothetical protein
MNRKNLTAAVLAGLAGAAGIAGTAQAVNINPDGLGQVLVYPYYTANDGNQTILSVVNTTDQAKAVKVRFLEGFNSREVLDFNLYLSHHDVWVASIADLGLPTTDGGPTPGLLIPDNSCTVPYLFADTGTDAYGMQPFLDLAYTGVFEDGGPTEMGRAAEGHFEIIEMGTLTNGSAIPADPDAKPPVTETLGSAAAATHGTDGIPANCEQLVENWTEYTNADNGVWFEEALGDGGQATTDTTRNSGGLFGGASVVNSENGTMYSYNAKAIQGYDKTDDGVHYIPGTIHPSLDDGDQRVATVFFGVPQNTAVELVYNNTIEAVSAVFMHENIMNTYITDDNLAAATEWIVTFPTKNFYVDPDRLSEVDTGVWIPDSTDPGCGGWVPGEDFPEETGKGPHDNDGWEHCTYVFVTDDQFARAPFTSLFDGMACETVGLQTWDRNEQTFVPDDPGGSRPPVVSPSIPGDCDPGIEICETTEFQLCYEVNVLRFGDDSIFGTPEFADEASLLLTIDNEFENGWGMIDLGMALDKDKNRLHVDYTGLVGLPVTGFSAQEFENEFVDGGDVKAFYGGLHDHRANVRRIDPRFVDPF